MNKILIRVLTSLLISIAIYLTIAGVLLLITPQPPEAPPESIDFSMMANVNYDELPDLQPYTTRTGDELTYRFYPATTETDRILIMIHGSAWHSMQFYPLATTISQNGTAHVVTPDMRGHGFEPATRGDIQYINQLEDDLADLIAVLRTDYPEATIIMGGHSSGGGMAIRFGGSQHGQMADAFALFAPYIKYNAPTSRPNSGGWGQPYTPRIIGLTMLNNVYIGAFNGLPVIRFNMPTSVLESELGHTATLQYTYRMNTGFAPRANYQQDLAAITQPVWLAAGTADESFIAEAYEPTLSPYIEAHYVIVPDGTHMGITLDPDIIEQLDGWLSLR